MNIFSRKKSEAEQINNRDIVVFDIETTELSTGLTTMSI